MARTVSDDLGDLKAICQAIPSPFTFLADAEIPLGTIDPDAWGADLPLGLLTVYRRSAGHRESGAVGNIAGRDNQYLLGLLASAYQGAATRVAERTAMLDFYSALEAALVSPDGSPCIDGAEWAAVELDPHEVVDYAGVQYLGRLIRISLDGRY